MTVCDCCKSGINVRTINVSLTFDLSLKRDNILKTFDLCSNCMVHAGANAFLYGVMDQVSRVKDSQIQTKVEKILNQDINDKYC